MSVETPSISVISPTPIEHQEMCKIIDNAHAARDQTLPAQLGSIGNFKVICVQGGKGEKYTASSTTFVSNQWKPRWIILAGIAGGFPSQGLERGDVVVANYVYDMDFGKLENGKYLLRPEYDYKPDWQLLEHAKKIAESSNATWSDEISATRPDGLPTTTSKAKVGYVASSDKVIDDPNHEFFKAVETTRPEIAAVEMEASGAGAAIHLEQSRRLVGFLMVRGISDTPISSSTPGIGKLERTAWKEYASAAAATFVRHVLESLSSAQSSSIATQVSFNARAKLANLLLACTALQDPNTRNDLVNLLRPQISHKINRANSAKADVMNILATCLDFDGGLAELTSVVKFYEGDSKPMRALESVIADIGPSL